MRLTLLGPFEARRPSGEALPLAAKKARALLAYLAVPAGRAQARESLAALLWGDLPDDQARRNLRHTLWEIRHALGDPEGRLVRTEGDTVVLDPAATESDVAALERALTDGSIEAVARAADGYRGELLAGFTLREAPFEDWLAGERQRLRARVTAALEQGLARQVSADQAERGIQTASRILALDPLHESAHRALMQLHHAQGRRTAALRQYQACVEVLARELGVEPDAQTKQLYQELLRQPAPRAVPDERRPAALAADPTPFVGREREGKRLEAVLESAAHGRGGVVAVVGEAGIGKTRLLSRIAAEALQRRARVLVGRAYQAERILPFGPWVDAFRNAGLADDAELRESLTPVWRGEIARLLPELGDPAAPRTAVEDPLRLFQGIAHLVDQLAAAQPAVIVLEDLHRADDMTARLLEFLGRRAPARPVVILVSAREEELADATALRDALDDLARAGALVRIDLGPLSEADTGALVRAFTRAGDPAAADVLARRVWGASEGNPFIAVETLGLLQQEDAAPPVRLATVPDRVQELVEARLDRLSDRGRQLLSAAAVTGRDFEFVHLQRASGLDEKEAAEGIEELVRRRVLRLAGERFDFAHDWIREVAYGALLPPRRRLLHRQAADALEALHADALEPHHAALARHYRAAEVWDKAIEHARHAGARAYVYGALREAAAAFEQALDALQRLPETREVLAQAIDLRFDLRHALLPLGEFGRISRIIEEAVELARRLGDEGRLGAALAVRGHYHCLSGQYDAAIDDCQRAGAIAAARDDSALATSAMFYEGVVRHALGDFRRSIELMERARAVAGGGLTSRRFGTTAFTLAYASTCLAWSLAELGDLDGGEAAAQEAAAIAEASPQPFVRYHACAAAGRVSLRRGEWDRLVTLAESYRDAVRGGHLLIATPFEDWFVAQAAALAGRPDAAALGDAAATRIPSEPKRAYFYSLWLANLGEAALAAGRVPLAAELAERALDVSRARNERPFEAWTLRLRGEVRLRQADLVRADADFRAAIELGEALSMRPLVAQSRLGLGRLAARRGDPAEARRELSAAEDIFRAIGAHGWLARAQAEREALPVAPAIARGRAAVSPRRRARRGRSGGAA